MPSSRYKSKVLRFVVQQSMKLRDRALTGARQLKLAATWGTQMALYPLYAIFQSARLVGQQLEQTARQIFPKLTAAIDLDQSQNSSNSNSPNSAQPLLPPESDRPIENVLNILEQVLSLSDLFPDQPAESNHHGRRRLKAEGRRQKAEGRTPQLPNSPTPQLPNSPTPQLPNSPTPQLQGIATLLTEKQLVLVGTDNQVHNVLNWEQQAALQQRIVFEVANYWRDRRQFAALEGSGDSPLGRRFLPLPKERDTMLPPVRYLRRFIAWMQTSPVAIATNVFQESALVPTQQSIDVNNSGLDVAEIMQRFGMANAATFGVLEPAPNAGGALASMTPDLDRDSKVSTPVQLIPLYPDLSTRFGPDLATQLTTDLSDSVSANLADHSTADLPINLSNEDFNALNSDRTPLKQLFPDLTNRLSPSTDGGGNPSGDNPAGISSVPISPNSLTGKRKSWWNKLLDWIVSPVQSTSSDDASKAAGQGPSEHQLPSIPTMPFPNKSQPDLGSLNASMSVNQVSANQVSANQVSNRANRKLPKELTRNLWFDPDYQGSEQGWFNANQINQVRRQREFPPVVPSLPARASLNLQTSPLNASYASIEANLTEMTEAGLITTHVSNTINESDLNPSDPFPESAAAVFNMSGGKPDPVSLEAYLAHHGVAYDFRRTEDSSLDRNVLYRVSADAETSVQDESRVFSLDIPGQPKGGPNASMTNTWLDTTAEVVGYDKHPLERLLGWVDSGMVWLEQRIAKVWYWVRDRF
ncbi:MAG: hypothetical protein AAGD25_09555 [Cyanobacteria bacterium P01_F01_bin.150]